MLVVSLAACGGGGDSVPANAVAVVGGVPVSTADFNVFLAQAVQNATAQTGVEPKVGTPQNTALRNQTVSELVEIAELKQQAPKLGVSITDKDVNDYIANLIKTQYGGSQAKFDAAVKKAKLTMDQAKQQVYVNLLATKIHEKVTAPAKVAASEERAYYTANIAQYLVQASTTRQVAHILVKSKALANKLETKLANGADFAALAKKYSTDTTSGANGGKLCISKPVSAGVCIQVVPEFAKAAFGLNTGHISAPVKSQYGWHVIKALGPVTKQKQHTAPFKEVEPTIRQALLQQAQQKLWETWVSELQKKYDGKVSYQANYAPPTTTALSTTVSTSPAPAG
jgi:foldase protein PrsA